MAGLFSMHSNFWVAPSAESKYLTAGFSWFEPILQLEIGSKEEHGFTLWYYLI